MKVVAISGKARHGKDTVATELKKQLEEMGGKVLIIHQGDFLKWIAKSYLGWNGKKDEEGRSLLQWIGTHNREVGLDDVYVETVINIIALLSDKFDYVIIPDLRYKNELHRLKAKYQDDCYLVRVNRVVFNNSKYSAYKNDLTEEQNKHKSETDLDYFLGWEYIITNYVLEGIPDQVNKIVEELKINA